MRATGNHSRCNTSLRLQIYKQDNEESVNVKREREREREREHQIISKLLVRIELGPSTKIKAPNGFSRVPKLRGSDPWS